MLITAPGGAGAGGRRRPVKSTDQRREKNMQFHTRSMDFCDGFLQLRRNRWENPTDRRVVFSFGTGIGAV